MSSAALRGLGLSAEVDGRLELYGVGPVPAKVMVVAECPGEEDIRAGHVFSDHRGIFLKNALAGIGLDSSGVYMTNLVKYRPKNGAIKAGDLKTGRDLLWQEIEAVQPDIIVCAGAHPVKELLGKSAKLSSYRGMLIDLPGRQPELPVFAEHEDEEPEDTAFRLREHDKKVAEIIANSPKPIKVFPIYNPGYIFRVPEATQAWEGDMRVLKRIIEGKPATVDPPKNTLIHTVEQLQVLAKYILTTYENPSIELDCEWHGNNYMEPGAYLRTIQLGYDDGLVVTLEMYDVDGNLIVTKPDEAGNLANWDTLAAEERGLIKSRMFQVLKVLLEHPRVSLSGHSIRSDGRWLLWHGVDIRDNTTYDTMIAEHTIDSRGPFGLEALTMKYTPIGRYDKAVAEWLAANPKLCSDGFGKVPRDLLLPYGAWDVEAPRQIRKAQAEQLAPYLKPRGQYPSLFEADMSCNKILYEMETEGLIVDHEQFGRIQQMYSKALVNVEVKLAAVASTLGLHDFNPRAVFQVRSLLFDTLGMTPIKTTKGSGNKPWDWVLDQDDETQEDAAASTDKDTLSILADTPGAHPIIGLLRDYRKVSYVCSNWLVDAEVAAKFNTESRGGGLLAKIWPDGRLHARFSQLKETARLGSAKPNV